MTDISSLIERLEKAEGPSRELDGHVRHFVEGDFAFCDAETGHTCENYPDCSDGEGCGKPWGMSDERRSYPIDWKQDERLPYYTSSLDAAIGIIPEGMEWSLTNLWGIARAAVGLNCDEVHPPFAMRRDGNMVLALLTATLKYIAALRAREEMK